MQREPADSSSSAVVMPPKGAGGAQTGPSLRLSPLSLHESRFLAPIGIQKSFVLSTEDKTRLLQGSCRSSTASEGTAETAFVSKNLNICSRKGFVVLSTPCLGPFFEYLASFRIIRRHRENEIQLFGGYKEAFPPCGFLFSYIQSGGDGSALVFVFN